MKVDPPPGVSSTFSNYFQVEKYKEPDMQEIIILCQAGRPLMEQNKEDENDYC